MSSDILQIPSEQMYAEFNRILLALGFSKDRAGECARIFTDNSIDGVYTHGVNRFPRFVEYVRKGYIDVNAAPTRISAAGGIEQWDGNLGPGPLNAVFCADRVTELAREHGIACVTLANTNHWMRGGTYGWRVAKAGLAYIGWTNTTGNMPAWGSKESRLGNNPLILAVPYQSEAIVLDMAMSQFSYGAIEAHGLKGRELPIPGGYDRDGNLTRNPAEILASGLPLPMGYWKGAGLSLLLDILAAVLSGGLSTHEISKREAETACSNVFIAIDLTRLAHHNTIPQMLNNIINDYLASAPADEEQAISYPGQRVLHLREENTVKGIPVDSIIWQEITRLPH